MIKQNGKKITPKQVAREAVLYSIESAYYWMEREAILTGDETRDLTDGDHAKIKAQMVKIHQRIRKMLGDV